MEFDIDVKKAKAVLTHASKRQTAALFRAILDYSETGKKPVADPEDVFSLWLVNAFAKSVIIGGATDGN